ncbi:hypothetical protein [Patulibacter defluvii]|uniref:hypothetical protein n=1 Tax=Patulibacter defluvii TaxID=3095358 RepID=UPI002A75C1DA|nr:hypothetical protein [Patulibacter sp. DM4]
MADRTEGSEPVPRLRGVAAPPSQVERLRRATISMLSPLAIRISSPRIWRYLWLVPPKPGLLRRSVAPKTGSWGPFTREVPENLREVAGVRRDEAAADAAYADEPLHDWIMTHDEAVRWMYKHGWDVYLVSAPRMVRAVRNIGRVRRREPASPPAIAPPPDPAELTRTIKEYGAEIGLSAIGVAEYDARYTLAEVADRPPAGDRMIVCIVEQNWAATQTSPSGRSERAAFAAFAEVLRLSNKLAERLQAMGYRAHAHDAQGETVVLQYAVQAGLGQMGANGNLLTPFAGSRARVTVVETNAPLDFDQPVDYGIHKICDSCQICARRCPAGAIPARRRPYRGVEKHKLNMARCAPVVAQAHGCAICMKTCPVQRYGLAAVIDEFEASGEILGKGSEELEGYTFEDRYYAPGERPTLRKEWMTPEGLIFDPSRTKPPKDSPRHF